MVPKISGVNYERREFEKYLAEIVKNNKMHGV